MTDEALLLSDHADRTLGERIDAIARDCAVRLERIALGSLADVTEPAAAARLARVTCAWFSRDVFVGDGTGGPSLPSRLSIDFFARVDAAPALRWLHVMSAGTDLPPYRPALARGVRLSTASGTTAVPIAQTVVAAVLGHARGVPGWLDAQRRRTWAPRVGAASPPDLVGQTATIVGMGPIGRETARLLRAIGLVTVGVRRGSEPLPDVERTLTYTELDTVLPTTDWLILCCPLSPQTRGLVDAARLARLPSHARVINVGRGPVVDERALAEALGAGRLAGAYLDVFEHEPLPTDSPLWDLPNVWLSPHNAAASLGNVGRDIDLFLANLGRWLRREPLANEAG